MPEISRTALVSHSPLQMFNVVNDVDRYGEFLPFCARGERLSGDEATAVCRVHLRKGPLRQSFTTRNRLAPPARIDLDLADGPFRSLTGSWRFDQIGQDACRVTMSVQFEFASALIGRTFGTVFKVVTAQVVDAFCDRADDLYG